MERTIRVTGKGKLSVRPDTVRLIMTMDGLKEAYDAALAESAGRTENLKHIFAELGFLGDDIKTQSFQVSAEYESYQAIDNSWERRFKGYRYVHRTKAEFSADSSRLGRVLYALGHAEARPELQIEYTVADADKFRNELLAAAVRDSKARAEVLADAAGVNLGSILTVDYSRKEIDFVSRPVERLMPEEYGIACESAAYDININPCDMDVTDQVTVVWQLL